MGKRRKGPLPSDRPRRLMTMTATMVAAETEQIKRLVTFAADASQLANERRDLELRDLIDQLHEDLLRTEEDR